MKIQYLLINCECPEILKDEVCVEISTEEGQTKEEALNAFFENNTPPQDITHFAVITKEDKLSDNWNIITAKYINEDNSEVMFMPLIELIDKEAEEGKDFKGILNSCMLKPGINEGILGEVDLDLAKKQVDFYLSGCIIPYSVILDKKVNFNTDIKHYSYLNFISKIAKEEVIIRSIPKILVSTTTDFVLKSVPIEEKREYFKKSQELV
jgi:hypothetical protein